MIKMVLTLDISEDLATRLRHRENELPRILELGLREVAAADEPGFKSLAEVLEVLASLPAPEEVLALRPSESFQKWLDELLEKNRAGGLSPEEEREWERYQYMEHLIRLAKARAKAKLAVK